ncbi:uncharacterized protein LOC117594751 [Esox lucius]|uniref:uncharacterized protein LOC117594751 n=1 Tax=Esox lucius TaxID=8010 RepID=UPI0014774C4B|nr:uncharacterized protein LOC117594751 [Esox lucius]
MVDQDIRYEALSALLGKPVFSLRKFPEKSKGTSLTVDEFLTGSILGSKVILTPQRTVQRKVLDLCFSVQQEFFIDEQDFFDPDYDYDFTRLSTSSNCLRGDEPYERPCGWYRMALKVLDKYPDGNTWLGPDGWRSESAPGEWPVSYHGTTIDGAKSIIKCHFKAGSRDKFGRGIYSTPHLDIARDYYTKTFKSMTNGKTYRVVMQNRINPCERVICPEEERYWLVHVPEGTSEEEEMRIVENSIRPYGILIQEVKH